MWPSFRAIGRGTSENAWRNKKKERKKKKKTSRAFYKSSRTTVTGGLINVGLQCAFRVYAYAISKVNWNAVWSSSVDNPHSALVMEWICLCTNYRSALMSWLFSPELLIINWFFKHRQRERGIVQASLSYLIVRPIGKHYRVGNCAPADCKMDLKAAGLLSWHRTSIIDWRAFSSWSRGILLLRRTHRALLMSLSRWRHLCNIDGCNNTAPTPELRLPTKHTSVHTLTN